MILLFKVFRVEKTFDERVLVLLQILVVSNLGNAVQTVFPKNLIFFY
jgi:hypothetical protein